MQNERVEPFVDNWAYLKAELNWLDRLLMLAIARQRKETKEVERVAQSRADRITSHWWKGLITLENEAAYDDFTPQKAARSETAAKASYQQQMKLRIQASYQQGIALGLPALCDRLNLTVFEKNLVLMSLAPEVNRRYARIYSYLQGDDPHNDSRLTAETLKNLYRFGTVHGPTELPSVDLVLRVLCRNDLEWREARSRLATTSPLTEYALLQLLSCQENTLLACRLRLCNELTNYLLADQPDIRVIEVLLQTAQQTGTATSINPYKRSCLQSRPPTADWSDLVLPTTLITDLQHLCNRIRLGAQVDEIWAFQQSHTSDKSQPLAKPGIVALFVGAPGTGKTMAAEAIAKTLEAGLFWVDLAFLETQEHPRLLQEIIERSPCVLLIQSAQIWLRPSSPLATTAINQFLFQRRHDRGITLLSMQFSQVIQLHWRQQLDQTLKFPLPDRSARLQLWQRAFPPQVPLDPNIDWELLAGKGSLSGGDIQAIAREAAFYAAASTELKLNMKHITEALKRKPRKSQA